MAATLPYAAFSPGDWIVRLPLPLGEGWGEGLGPRRPQLISLSLNATHRTLSTNQEIGSARKPSSPALLPEGEGGRTDLAGPMTPGVERLSTSPPLALL